MKLCFTDTDSLLYEVQTDDIYKDMQQNLDWFSHPIPTDFWAELKQKGLLREDAPVPT